jgi:pimeloyl-ACP methyl ester carboxylesterase
LSARIGLQIGLKRIRAWAHLPLRSNAFGGQGCPHSLLTEFMKSKHLALGIGGALGAAVAWKFLTRANSSRWEDFFDKVHHAEHSRFVEIDGATVHFQEFGEPNHPTLLLIHGYRASTYVWRTVAPQLAAAGFHVVAVDLIGFGYSDKPKWFDYKIQSQARIIERLMNRLGIGTATLVGNSYGGAVALTFALDYPERVAKLVLVDAVCNDEVLAHPILKLAALPGVGEIITPFLVDSKTLQKRLMKGTFAPENHHLITKERIDSADFPLHAKDAHHSVLETVRKWDACRIQTDAQYITHPTLIIWGEKDTVIPIHNGEYLYNTILHSRFVVLKNCGHIPQEEKPELFINLVKEFAKDRKGKITINEEDEVLLEGI